MAANRMSSRCHWKLSIMGFPPPSHLLSLSLNGFPYGHGSVFDFINQAIENTSLLLLTSAAQNHIFARSCFSLQCAKLKLKWPLHENAICILLKSLYSLPFQIKGHAKQLLFTSRHFTTQPPYGHFVLPSANRAASRPDPNLALAKRCHIATVGALL